MMAAVELKQDDQSDQVILSNEIVSIAFNMSNGTYAITDKSTGQLMVDQAAVSADSWRNTDGMRFTGKQEEVNDSLGHGRRLVVEMEQPGESGDPGLSLHFCTVRWKGWGIHGFWHEEYDATGSPVDESLTDDAWKVAGRKAPGGATNA